MSYSIHPLTDADIPAILEISKDIWEGDDYIPHIIHKWIKANDAELIGVFASSNSTLLLGFGRITWYTPAYVWFEGGRIRKEYQKAGIGKFLFQWALEYITQKGAKIVQFDTSSVNYGSIGLAQHFNFREKTRMRALLWDLKKANQLKLPSFQAPIIPYSITTDQAYIKLKLMPNGPISEFNLGWSYIPFKLEVLKKSTSDWYIHHNAVLLMYHSSPQDSTRESPSKDDIWLILYGEEHAAQELLISVLGEMQKKKYQYIQVFCPELLAPMVEQLGFGYYHDEVASVILYEKKLI